MFPGEPHRCLTWELRKDIPRLIKNNTPKQKYRKREKTSDSSITFNFKHFNQSKWWSLSPCLCAPLISIPSCISCGSYGDMDVVLDVFRHASDSWSEASNRIHPGSFTNVHSESMIWESYFPSNHSEILFLGRYFSWSWRCNTPFLLEHGFTFVSNDFIEKLPTKLYVRRRMTQRETNFYVQLLCAVCTWSGVYVYRTQRSPLLRHALLVFFGGCDIIWSSWNIQVFRGFGVSARKVTNISKQHSLVAA